MKWLKTTNAHTEEPEANLCLEFLYKVVCGEKVQTPDIVRRCPGVEMEVEGVEFLCIQYTGSQVLETGVPFLNSN